MDRRTFLKDAALIAAALRSRELFAEESVSSNAPTYKTSNQRWQTAYDCALNILAGNVRVLPRYDKSVLIEGSNYAGIWMECGPHESLVYRKFRPDVARNSHMTFFTLQHEDGQLPANNKLTEAGFGQIQMVVPIAATAWELAEATGDDELLAIAYRSCSRWDDWLLRYRNTRGTGLTEGFCTYDTGMDNSPRWQGMPPQCPGKDAKVCSPVPSLPRLCPDLSATTYGARAALAAMATALGKSDEAAMWSERAENIRRLILSRLYVADDAAFYDLDAQSHFVKINCCIVTRVCGEHVVDQDIFDDLWARQIHNQQAFWAAYPLPSVALDDPLFVRPIPGNSWGGASQALTALRAARWFDRYGRMAEFGTMMDRWCDLMQRDLSFRQQVDPVSGDFTKADKPDYSPAALVMLDYTWRLSGVHEERDVLHWNVRLGYPASEAAHFSMRADNGAIMEMQYVQSGVKQGCELRVANKLVARIEHGTVRIVTDKHGTIQALEGIHIGPQRVVLSRGGKASQTFQIRPNERFPLTVA